MNGTILWGKRWVEDTPGSTGTNAWLNIPVKLNDGKSMNDTEVIKDALQTLQDRIERTYGNRYEIYKESCFIGMEPSHKLQKKSKRYERYGYTTVIFIYLRAK